MRLRLVVSSICRGPAGSGFLVPSRGSGRQYETSPILGPEGRLTVCGRNGPVHIGMTQGTRCNVAVVVTGAGGFIGRHLATTLVDSGETVVGIDRRRPSGTVS